MQYVGRHGIALMAFIIALAPTLVSGQTLPAESSGTLDASFGTGGTVTTDFGGTSAAARAVAVQPDGKIVAAGLAAINGVLDFALARYNPDGTLDASFGAGGTVTTLFDFPGSFDRVTAVALQPDGKIVIAGETVNVFANFALARFNSDGSLDTSFGTGGIVTTNFGQVSAEAWSVAVQADGKIVAAGEANVDGGESFALARYNSNGTLDASFGTGGKVTTAFTTTSFAFAFSLAIQPDGRIVAAGYASTAAPDASAPNFDFALARYNSNGTLDASFGTGGRVTTDFAGPNDQASSMAIQPDGRIVVAGAAGPYINRRFDFALARYNSDGTLDASFGTGGKATTDFAGFNDRPSSIALPQDGKIVVVGVTSSSENDDFALARYNSNGTLDTSFGTSGKVTTDFGGATDQPTSVALQADGKIVVAGYAFIGGRYDFALARYVASAALAPDIDTAPASLTFGNVTQGSFNDLAVIVRNTGSATLSVTSTTLVGPASAEYAIVAGGGAFSLAPAATRQVTVRLTPTSLGTKAATLSFASNDTDENPKNVTLSGTAGDPSDLVVSALTGPTSAGAGFAVTLNDTTGNVGVGPAGSTSTRFYLSSDTVIGTGDVLLGGGRSLASLAPGGSSAGATNVTIPAGTANGSYFIVARADDANQASESNESNNTRAITIRIGPDLRVSSLTAPAYGAAGGTISISDTTANLSASSPAGASTTRFYLSSNTTLDAADIPLGSRAVPALASGASNAGGTLVTIPAGTATGTYNILAVADGAHVLAEKNESNNLSTRILRVGPDLAAAVRGITGTLTAGATISVQDLTSNPSAAAVSQSTTAYYLSTDNRLDATDVRIGSRAVPALVAGGSSLASGQAVIPAGTVPGAYFILAVADYPKVVVESNEGNNTNAFPITVVP